MLKQLRRALQAGRPMRSPAVDGFTLLELAIVISIIGLIAAIAIPNISQMLPRYRLNTTLREFCDKIQLARLLAVSENVEYRICLYDRDTNPSDADIKSNSGRYTLEVGNLSSGSTVWDILPRGSNNQEGSINFAYAPGNTSYAGISFVQTLPEILGGTGIGNTDCLVFSPRGWIANNMTDFRWNYIQVQFRNKASNPREDVRWIHISRGGVARIRTTSRSNTDPGDTN